MVQKTSGRLAATAGGRTLAALGAWDTYVTPLEPCYLGTPTSEDQPCYPTESFGSWPQAYMLSVIIASSTATAFATVLTLVPSAESRSPRSRNLPNLREQHKSMSIKLNYKRLKATCKNRKQFGQKDMRSSSRRTVHMLPRATCCPRSFGAAT